MATICIFGDSVGEGYYDSEKGGWVEQLRRYLNVPNAETNIYNLSISGDSTREILARFDNEIAVRNPDTIIFAVGTNDSWYSDNDKTKVNVSLEDFEENLNLLISKCQGKNTIFIGLEKVDESKTKPVSWDEKIYYDNESISKYNTAIEKVCAENNLKFIAINHLLDNNDLADGAHPNTKGHTKLFEEIKKHFDS